MNVIPLKIIRVVILRADILPIVVEVGRDGTLCLGDRRPNEFRCRRRSCAASWRRFGSLGLALSTILIVDQRDNHHLILILAVALIL